MSDPTPPIPVGRWINAHEEQEGDVEVYRPAGYPLPRSRGRKGLEIRPDGEFADLLIGADDRSTEVVGRWTAEGDRKLKVRFPESARPDQEIDVLEAGKELIKVRRRTVG